MATTFDGTFKVRTVVEAKEAPAFRASSMLLQHFENAAFVIEADKLGGDLFTLTLSDGTDFSDRLVLFLNHEQLIQVADTILAFDLERSRKAEAEVVRIPVVVR